MIDYERLVRALNSVGLEAQRLDVSGQDRVVVPVLNVQTEPSTSDSENPELEPYAVQAGERMQQQGYLYIATRQNQGVTEVGVLGLNGTTGEEYASEDWDRAGSIEEAVEAFRKHWDQRDQYLSGLAGLAGQSGA